MKNRIVFFFPWKEISGGPRYLTSLANELSKNAEYEVYYTDYKNGLAVHYLGEDVKLLEYTDPFIFPIRDEVTLITPIYCASHIPKLHPQSKILFVNWHNYCIQALLDIWRLDEENLQAFLRLVYENNAVFFLDRSHWIAQNEWICPPNRYSFQEQYIPGQVAGRESRARKELVGRNKMALAVLGRLSRDKIFAVLNFLSQLEKVQFEGIKCVFVIGDGPEKGMLEKYKAGSKMSIELLGTVTGKKLETFLANQVDALFGMGLSVLEGGVIGLPSIIIPHDTKAFSVDKFTYLQESCGGALGWSPNQIDQLEIQWHSLSSILEDIYFNGKKADLGKQALEYTRDVHSSVGKDAVKIVSTTQLTAEHFYAFSKQQGKVKICGMPIGRLSTSFDEREKRICFLGIRNFLVFQKDEGGGSIYFFGKKQRAFSARKENGVFRIFFFNKKIPFIKL